MYNTANQAAQTATNAITNAASSMNSAAAGLSSYGIQGLSSAPAGTQVVMGNGGAVSANPNLLGSTGGGFKNFMQNVGGKALAGIGTAIGGYTMANQIAGFGDHRSASDMMANVGR